MSKVKEFQVTFDCHDPQRVADFWCDVLGYVDLGGDPGWAAAGDPDGVGPRLFFQRVPEGKTVKNRLDLRPTDRTRDAEVVRLLGLGARQLADHRRPDGGGWVTLADPEGNEFCVLRGTSEADDPYAHLVTDGKPFPP